MPLAWMLQSLIFVSVLTVTSYNYAIAQNLDQKQRALDLITNTAERICGEALTSGNIESSEVQGKVEGQLKGLASKLAEAGISGSGKIVNEQYKGVLRSELASTLHDIRRCKLTILQSLKGELLGSRDQSLNPIPSTRSASPPTLSGAYEGVLIAELAHIDGGRVEKAWRVKLLIDPMRPGNSQFSGTMITYFDTQTVQRPVYGEIDEEHHLVFKQLDSEVDVYFEGLLTANSINATVSGALPAIPRLPPGYAASLKSLRVYK
jgi:hypothetical protein